MGTFSALCRFLKYKASPVITRKANKKECVKPRCANKPSVVFNQKEAMKSMSGKLAAIAPYNMAFLPILFPKKRSPIQAPIAICVKLSIYS